nr:hypothetical protein [Tanacetum cinerariifolium]
MLYSKAYKEYYAVASGAEPPKEKTKYKKKADEHVISLKSKTTSPSKGTRLMSKAKVAKPDMKKQLVKKTKAQGLAVLSKVALTEAKQIKLFTKRIKKDFYISHASSLCDGVDTQSKVPDEQQQKTSGTYEGTGTIPGVPDVPLYESESDEIPGLNLTNVDKSDYKEEDVDERVRTPSDYELTDEEKLDDEETIDDEEDDEFIKELYDNKADEPVQSSSVSSDFTSKFQNLENPSPTDNEISSLMETSAPHATAIPEIIFGFTIVTPPPPLFFNPFLHQQTPTITTPTFTTTTSTNLTVTLSEIPNFASVLKFDQRVSTLESKMSELKQTNHFSKVVSSISGIVDKYLASKIKEAMSVAIQLQTNKLRKEAQAENQEFLNQDEMIKTRMKNPPLDQTKGQKDRNQVKMMSPLKIQGLRKRSLQPPPKMHPNLNISLSARNNDEQPADKEVTKADWSRNPSDL